MGIRNRGFWLSLAVLVLCAILGGIYGPQVQATGASTDVQDAIKQFTRVFAIVEQNYADPVDPERAIYLGAIPGMLRTLDPHSAFFDPRSFNLLREEQHGRYYGVGMQVAPRDGKTVVLAPFYNSPAYRAGVRPGDIILAVDGKPTDNMTTTQVADMLKGPKGTPVSITLGREGLPQPLNVSVIRDEIPRHGVDQYLLVRPGIGYIRLTSFNEVTDKELSEALVKLNAKNLQGLILDLRNNPGGLLSEGVAVADMFLQKNQLIVSHRGRGAEKPYYATHGSGGLDVSIVVLINHLTASAAEIVAGAMQDHDRAVVLGETSFGKGLVQTVYPLDESTGLALTTAKYYTPSGRLIQRDYSHVSLYDYYYGPKGNRNKEAEVKQTDSGREVFGGGGINPDVAVPAPELNRFQQLLLRRDVVYPLEMGVGGFAKYYLAEHPDVPRDFQVNDEVLQDFREYLDRQKVSFTEPDITENLDWIKRKIKRELFLSVYGANEAFRVELEGDVQVQKAIASIPMARDLNDRAKRILAERLAQQPKIRR